MAVSHHFIFRHGEAAALGAWNWLLGVVFALLEVVGERVQLDHHRAAVQLIVTPANTVTRYRGADSTVTFYRISNLLSKFLSILGTGLSSAIVIVLRSTGQVCCLLSHSTIQSAQKACSHLTQPTLKIRSDCQYGLTRVPDGGPPTQRCRWDRSAPRRRILRTC